MTRRLIAICLLLAVVAVTGACADTVSPPAASVNNRDISQDALDAELDAMLANRDFVDFLESQGNTLTGTGEGTFGLPFVARVLTRQIYFEVVHQEALRRGIRLSDADRDSVRQDVARSVGGPEIFAKFRPSYQRALLNRNAEVARVQLALSGVSVDPDAMRKFYDENTELFLQTCVHHVVFAVLTPAGEIDTAQTEARSDELSQLANATKARLDAGTTFEALGAELQGNPASLGQVQDLGCGPAGRFTAPELEIAVEALQPGQVSAPVKTQFGWHILRVDAREAPPFEAVEEEVRQRLTGEAQEGFGAFLRGELNGARIHVNPRFGRFDKEGQNPGIVTPTAPTTLDVGGPSSDGAGGGVEVPIDLGN